MSLTLFEVDGNYTFDGATVIKVSPDESKIANLAGLHSYVDMSRLSADGTGVSAAGGHNVSIGGVGSVGPQSAFNGQPVMHLPNDMSVINVLDVLTTDFTVMMPVMVTQHSRGFFNSSGNDYNATSSDAFVSVELEHSGGKTTRKFAVGFPLNAPKIFMLSFDSASISVGVASDSVQTPVVNVYPGYFDAAGFDLLSGRYGGSVSWQGYFGDVMVFNRALHLQENEATRLEAMQIMSDRFGIALT